jgi:4-amino-4-deoxy-L-arabinose transferase-like glycosyltransferase
MLDGDWSSDVCSSDLIQEEVYFSGDAGLKALLMKQFSAGVLEADLRLEGPDWAKRLWDQGLYPFAPLFVTASQGKHYLAYAPVFALMSAPLYKLFGLRGMYLLPLLGAWLGWLLLLRAARRLNLGPWARAAGLAGLSLATPLVVYSATFWEHTLNASLGLAGLVLLFHPAGDEGRAGARLTGGFILGLSLWLRPETIALFGPALLVLLATERPGHRLRAAARAGLGLALGVGLVWLTLWPLYGRDILAFGQPLGHHSDLAAAGRSFAGLILQANQVLFKEIGRAHV